MSYINDPRENIQNPELGYMLESDNRVEDMYKWSGKVLDLCNLPIEEYMKPMTVITLGGGILPDTGETLYTLKFVIDGVVVSQEKLASGDPIVFNINTVKEERRFLGWYYNNTKYEEGAVMPSKNLTLTAKYECDVKFIFVVDGVEEEILSYTVAYNTKVNNIPSTDKEGYKFLGWEPSIENAIIKHTIFKGVFEHMEVNSLIYYGAYVTSARTAEEMRFETKDMGEYFKTATFEELLKTEGKYAPIFVPADEYLCSDEGQNLSDADWEKYCNQHILAQCWLVPKNILKDYTFIAEINGDYEVKLYDYKENVIIDSVDYHLFIFLNPDLTIGDSSNTWEYKIYLK